MGVISLKDWENIRIRAIAHGESIKSIARSTGHARNTIRKYLRADPPPQQRPSRRTSTLAPYLGEIHELIEKTPKITARRIASVLRERHDRPLRIGARSIRKFIAKHRRMHIPKEAFIRLVYAPGSQMQVDFKDIFLAVNGESIKHHLFTARLCHSDGFFGKVYRSEDTPSLLDGIVESCVFFEGVPAECVFDNAKTAVTKVLRGRQRIVADQYRVVCGELGTQMHFAAPGKGNEKGGVEGKHGYIEDNFFRPLRSGDDLDVVNRQLRTFCIAENQSAIRLAVDLLALRPLPARLPDTHVTKTARINKFSEITYATHRYSVPSEYAYREAMLRISATHVVISVADEIVAAHKRSFVKHGATLNPLHYIELLSHKHRAVERAEVFASPDFPAPLRDLLRCYVDSDRDTAGKQFTRVMQLLKTHSLEEIVLAVTMTRRRGTTDPAAIELLIKQRDYTYAPPLPLVMPHRTPQEKPDLSAYSVRDLREEAA